MSLLIKNLTRIDPLGRELRQISSAQILLGHSSWCTSKHSEQSRFMTPRNHINQNQKIKSIITGLQIWSPHPIEHSILNQPSMDLLRGQQFQFQWTNTKPVVDLWFHFKPFSFSDASIETHKKLYTMSTVISHYGLLEILIYLSFKIRWNFLSLFRSKQQWKL